MDIFKGEVVGYKNKIKRIGSQDYIDYKFFDNCIICAVADGHSTSYFEYSDIGAKLACKVSIEVLKDFIGDIDYLEDSLREGVIQKLICDKWMASVDEHYRKFNPIVCKTEYIKYSTTLAVAFLKDEFRLYLKIGDGGIIQKSDSKYEKILDIQQKHILDSIGRCDSFKNIKYDIKKISKDYKSEDWLIMFTDGYENSFSTEEELFKSLEVIISNYNKNIFSKLHLNTTCNNYLNKLSKEKTKDDISIIFVKLSH